MMIRNKIKIIMTAVAGLSLVLAAAPTLAATTVTSQATATVSSDSATGSAVELPALTLTEGAAGEIPAGTLTWALPTGFIFDTASVADVAYTGTGLGGDNAVTFPNNTHVSVNVTSTSTAAGSLTIGANTHLKVKAASGTPLATTGNITLSTGTLAGLASTTSFGSLTQVPGQAAKLAFTTQPSANVAVGTAFSAAVSVQDQFGNTVTSDSNRAISLSVVAVNPTTTTGSLSGTTTVNNTSGVAAFNNLSFSQAGTIKLKAASGTLTNAESNNIVLTSTTPTPTPTSTIIRILPNGILVQVQGNATVYMVVNNTLRPFTTPAIFHAKGKKFTDIVIISGDTFAKLGIGKPVGQGSDNDDTLITPPLASSTIASLTNLPEGTLIKIPGNSTVYMVSGGQLKPFTSLSVFKAHKKDFKDVQEISSTTFNSLPVGSPVAFPDGTLVKGSGQTIYVIIGGKKLGIPSMESLRKHNRSLNNLMQIQNQELGSIESDGTED